MKNTLSSSKNKFGFTLAETLITLGIIGVVAAITIPTLVQKYQKMVLVNQLKSTFSILSTGYRLMISQEGYDNIAELGDTTCPSTFNCSLDEQIRLYKKYFKIISEEPYSSYHQTEYKYRNSNSKVNNISFHGTLVLSNGAYILYQRKLISNIDHLFDYDDIRRTSKAKIAVDVNGGKGPNVEGRDLFYFNIKADGSLEPLNGTESEFFDLGTLSYKDAGNVGAKRIIEKGWVMDY